ncbi:hypothetical protein AC579_4198 [Pseudocercospora musae]|uniref:F-box domain-containing protein n=1 Tax=Pseudocercospora musae TaxID=113226 RepID=A0A139IGV8_9PEZI|nr:hypothetical protein AC579_4198 [Pseudocercospora musae]
MRDSLVAAALAIIYACSSNANILGFKKTSQSPSTSTCHLTPSDLLNLTIGPTHNWSQTAEALRIFAECADQWHTTRELSINISIPFEAPPSRIKTRLEKIMETIDSGIEYGFTRHQTVEFRIRLPQNIVHQAEFREHGYAEYHYRQEDFNTHDPSKSDLETAGDIDWRRFDFMAPFKPETAQIALREYGDSLQPTLLPVAPSTELLKNFTTILRQMTNLETLRLRIDPPEYEVISQIDQTFLTDNLTLPSIKSLDLSPGTHFFTAFTPNLTSITSIGVFNTTSAFNSIRYSPKSLQYLSLRTRWDERKLQAIVENCPNLTTLHMLPPTPNGQMLKYRRVYPYGGVESALLAPTKPVPCPRKSLGPRGPRNVTRFFEEMPKLDTLVVT